MPCAVTATHYKNSYVFVSQHCELIYYSNRLNCSM